MGKPKKAGKPSSDSTNDWVIGGGRDPYSRTDDLIPEAGTYVIDLGPPLKPPKGVAVYNRDSRDRAIFLAGGTIIKIESNIMLSTGEEFCWVVAEGVNSNESTTIFSPRRHQRKAAEMFMDRLAGELRRVGWIVINTEEVEE